MILGEGTIVKVSDSSLIPYNKLTVTQTWGREVPTINFKTSPIIVVNDSEIVDVKRDGTAIMRGVLELGDVGFGDRNYSGRVSPSTSLYRVVPPQAFNAEPAELLAVMNQPVKARLLPYITFYEDEMDDLATLDANTEVRIPSGGQLPDVPYGPPAFVTGDFATAASQYIGMCTDDHGEGVGVICMGDRPQTDGLHLYYGGVSLNNLAATAITLVARVKVLQVSPQKAQVFLCFTNGPPQVTNAYLLKVNFDATTNNIQLLRCPSLATPANWVVVAQASADLTAEKGKYITVKLSRRNRGTIAAPRYFWKGGVVTSTNTTYQIDEHEDNTYVVQWWVSIGCLGGGGAGQDTHMHIDRFVIMETDRIPADVDWPDIYPWTINTSSDFSGAFYLGSDILDTFGENGAARDPPTFWCTEGVQALNNYMRVDMAASKTGVCRVDVIGPQTWYPSNFKIQISNDATANPTNWTDVFTKTGNTCDEIYAVFPPVTCRHVRIIITSGVSRLWAVSEIRIYQADGNPIFTLGTVDNYGSPVPYTPNWNTIWDIMHDLGDSTGFHVWLNARTGALNYSATRGTDLSATVIFEEGRNIILPNFRLTHSVLEQVDRVWVIGKAAAEGQAFGYKATTPLPADYRERVFTASTIGDPTVLTTLATKLYDVLNSPIDTISMAVYDTYATGAYDVGDLVQVNVPSRNIADKYRILNIIRTFQGGLAETTTLELASPAVIALQVLEQICTQNTVVAGILLQKKIHDLQITG